MWPSDCCYYCNGCVGLQGACWSELTLAGLRWEREACAGVYRWHAQTQKLVVTEPV